MKKLLLILVLFIPGIGLSEVCRLLPATDSQVCEFGPLVDSTDAAPETGLAPIADTEFQVCQDGGSCAAKSDTTDATHLGDGVYAVTYNTTDSTANSHICVSVNLAGVLARKECYLIEAQAWQDLRNGTTTLMTSEDAGLRYKGTINGAPAVQTEPVIATSGAATNDDAYNGMMFVAEGGTETGGILILDYDTGTKKLFLKDTPPFTLESGDTVWIFANTSQQAVIDLNDFNAASDTVDVGAISGDTTAADNLELQYDTTGLTGDTFPAAQSVLDALVFDTGTCDSGSTTTCVDAAAFTTADADYYAKGFAIQFTNGTLDKQMACIYDFDPETDKVTFRPSLTQAVSTHTYILLAHPTCGGVIAP